MATLRFGNDLYIGDTVSEMFKSAELVVDRLKRRIPVLNIYLVCLGAERGKLLEIINSSEIFKAVYGNGEYLVVGLAHGKSEAYGLVWEIVSDFVVQGMA